MNATETKPATVRFLQYFVTNGTAKVRVRYSLDNRHDGKACVTIWDDGYGHDLAKILPTGEYRNETEIQTDYFEHGRVILYADHPLYAAARARAELNLAKWAAHYAKVEQRRRDRREALATN